MIQKTIEKILSPTGNQAKNILCTPIILEMKHLLIVLQYNELDEILFSYTGSSKLYTPF